MRAIFCQDCRDLVVATFIDEKPVLRTCVCRRHIVWKRAHGGTLMVYDSSSKGVPSQPRAFVLAISDTLVLGEQEIDDFKSVETLVTELGASRLGLARSLILKNRPGRHPRVEWAETVPADLAMLLVGYNAQEDG